MRSAIKGLSDVHRRIRIIVAVNFPLILLMLSPLGGQPGERILRTVHLEELLPWAVNLWVIFSTLFATFLFVRDLTRVPGAVAAGHDSRKGLTLDGVFLGALWLTVAVIVIWAFTLGLAG